MKRIRLLLVGATLAGCGLMPRHEVNISPKLIEHPVHSIVIFEPVFPDKIKRTSQDDLAEMLPERQAASAGDIRRILTEVLSTTVTVDAAFEPDRLAQQWATGILRDLGKGMVPLSVDPVNIAAEAVLLVGVPSYGTEDMQWHLNFLWFKDRKLGRPKWEYTCDLQALLVDPRSGAVLFDVRNEYRERATGDLNPAVLAALTRTCAGDIARAFNTTP